MFNQLKKIPTERIYNLTSDINNNVYAFKGGTFLLTQKDMSEARLFDLNTYQTWQCSAAHFDKMVSKKKMVQCQYMLISSFDRRNQPKDPFFISASNDLGKLYNQLARSLQKFEGVTLLLESCCIKDTTTGRFFLHGHTRAELKDAIAKYREQHQKFQPTSIDINQALTTAQKNPSSEQALQPTRKR